MNPDLEVDADDLRRTASAVAGLADQVTTAASAEPVPATTPRWATTDAAALAAEATRGQLAVLGADLTETARRITEAAAAYEIADARAATRLRLTR
ncbi:type VII secretion target [Micromonosporaceae bacterium Da 78-11]